MKPGDRVAIRFTHNEGREVMAEWNHLFGVVRRKHGLQNGWWWVFVAGNPKYSDREWVFSEEHLVVIDPIIEEDPFP